MPERCALLWRTVAPASIPSRSDHEDAIEKLTFWLLKSPQAAQDFDLVQDAIERDLAQRGEPGHVVKALAPLKAVFRIENGEAEGRLFWAVYEALLVDTPPWAIRAGAKAYTLDPANRWFPRPAQIHDAARQAMVPLIAARYRLQEARKRADERRREAERQPISDELRAQMAEDLRNLARPIPQPARTGETQAQMAERLRAAAEQPRQT